MRVWIVGQGLPTIVSRSRPSACTSTETFPRDCRERIRGVGRKGWWEGGVCGVREEGREEGGRGSRGRGAGREGWR